MALTGSSSPHFYLARSRSTSLPPVAKSSPSHLASGGNGTSFPFSSSPSSVSWPSSMLPCLALAFDDPSFFADLRIDINPLTTSSTTSSTTLSSCASSSSMSTQNGGKESSRPSSRTSSGEGPEDLGVGGDVGRTSPSSSSSLPSSAASSSSSVVWVHRMVLAVHSPVFRSLLRDTGGSREAREGVIDMRGPEHPPGAVVRCMLKMMYASPGLAIDELGKEPKLSDEWEFLLQLFKLAHLYQVEVVLDACTRRIKHILERKDLGGGSGVHAVGGTRMRRRRSSSAKSPSTATGNNNSLKDVEEDLLLAEEEEERMRQTCYALELLAFLLHVKEAETRSYSSTPGDVDENDNNDSSNDVDLRRVHKNWKKAAAEEEPLIVVGVAGVDAKSPTMPARSGEAGTAGEDMDQQHQQQVGLSERREEMLVRLLDQHLYPQLLTIVQHIRCEDVLTLQHLLQLSVCRPSPVSPVSPPPAWPGGPGARTSHVKHLHGGSC